MPATIHLEIKNLAKFKKKLNDFPQVTSVHLANGINKAIIAIEKSTLPFTPKKTGSLRSQFALDRVTASPKKLWGAVRNTTDYAVAVHDLYSAGKPYKFPTTAGTVAGFLIVGANKSQVQVNGIFRNTLEDITKSLAK